MIFDNFTYTTIAPGVNPNPPGTCDLTMVNPLQGGSRIHMGEGVHDTYGADYFTAGPQITADVILNAPLTISYGTSGLTQLNNSAMMFSGQITNPLTKSLTCKGSGGAGLDATSLWISSNNEFNGDENNPIIIMPYTNGFEEGGGNALHLCDAGRMNSTPIELKSWDCYLGLQDNTVSGLGPNQYLNSVKSWSGNVFADRSYQLDDLKTTVNVLQQLDGVTVYGGTTTFGSAGNTPFGHTNNGYSIRLGSLNWDYQLTDPDYVSINVDNGNLTQGRGGSRYVSGANRLQEAHNYTYVENVSEIAENPVQYLLKGGDGVLAVEQVNGGGQWLNSPQVGCGVLRLGTPTNSHNAPSVILLGSSSAVGFGWDANINPGGIWGPISPFPIISAGAVYGQCGAVDVDMWGHGIIGNILNPNVWSGETLTCFRVGSSMGADASFDPQPDSQKHASTSATIVASFDPAQQRYYLGGGGGTLRIDSVLQDHNPRSYFISSVEMGTTGSLLPGRIALNPVGGEESNTYTGVTDIWAGTLQLMKRKSLFGTSNVSLTTNCTTITNALYDTPTGFNDTLWKGPGQLLLDPGRNGVLHDWSLEWYKANGGGPAGTLYSVLKLDGGVIGWTGDVNLGGVPGTYGATITSNMAGGPINVLGLGGEYSAGTMTTWFQITDSGNGRVLLYKAGNNSNLDLRNTPVDGNTFSGGTIIAGGEIIVNDSAQLNAEWQNDYGGPIVILNGGCLHYTAGPNADNIFWKKIMVNTDGTPDLVKNCGSVLEVDEGVTMHVWSNFDFSWAPTQYLEKTGDGTFFYDTQNPHPNPGPASAWGLKLTAGPVTAGLVIINQLPLNPDNDTGPVIFNGGDLQVMIVPPVMNGRDFDPTYGFRNIVSFKGTTSTVSVDDSAMFRTHGSVPNEILGTVHFKPSNPEDTDPSDNVVHLSRNTSPSIWPDAPGYSSRGNGTLSFEGVTVYMSGGGPGNSLNVLPQEAGFTLQLKDGVVFNASHQNNVWGEVNFDNINTDKPIKIDGEEANATPSGGPPYTFNLVVDTWTIYGTGLTAWSGTTEKIGDGTVAIKRSVGAPVLVNDDTLLQISGGTFEAGGSADPFTDTSTGVSLDILNDSSLLISEGIKVVDAITGTGGTTIDGPTGTELIVNSIVQGGIYIGPGCKLSVKAAASGPLGDSGTYTDLNPVPEPSSWIMLIIAGAGLLSWRLRRRSLRSG